MAFRVVVSDPVGVLDMVLAGNNPAGCMADRQHRAVPCIEQNFVYLGKVLEKWEQ